MYFHGVSEPSWRKRVLKIMTSWKRSHYLIPALHFLIAKVFDGRLFTKNILVYRAGKACNTGNDRIQEFTSNGTFITKRGLKKDKIMNL
jgi:hypothetical protein